MIIDQLSIYTSMKHSLIWPLKSKHFYFKSDVRIKALALLF